MSAPSPHLPTLSLTCLSISNREKRKSEERGSQIDSGRFYFIAEIQLSVNIDCKCDFLVVTKHISASLNADLKLWGPDKFGGNARVNFWLFGMSFEHLIFRKLLSDELTCTGFTIDFGDGLRSVTEGIPLVEFYEMVRTAGPDGKEEDSKNAQPGNDGCLAQHKYSIEDGLYPEQPKSDSGEFPDTGASFEWKVLAGTLQIRIDCDFALSQVGLKHP
jgi:hypothetical protein